MLALLDLAEFSHVISAAAKAVGKITDSISHLVRLGDNAFATVYKRTAKARLKQLSKHLTVIDTGNAGNIVQLDDYVETVESLERPISKKLRAILREEWRSMLNGTADVTIIVERLLVELKNEHSDFVLEGTYRELIKVLTARAKLFNRLRSATRVEPPTSPEQLAALRLVHIEWVKLVAEIERANIELAVYLKAEAAPVVKKRKKQPA